MKIERISENQIRCTLNKHDLMERHLKISELAYGSEKAKELFRDMMEQANIDFGFDADDIPLMIEAIPTSRESIVLVITKVENQEEFDEKFSHFGLQDEDLEEDEDFDYDEEEDEEDAETSVLDSPEIVNCFEQLHELIEEAEAREDQADSREFIPLSEALQNKRKKKASKKKKTEDINERIKVFSFVSLNPIIKVAHLIPPSYTGKNSVWKDETGNRYYLLLNRGGTKNTFRSTCSVISEFGKEEMVTYATQDYFNEHFQIIIRDKALAQLAQL
ncbi:MAG: adaptor protein MecA [Lachnospiraceae bacterium]|nr:adaptor protein MecA [Lachnospiraceae bacterium]